MEVTQDEGARPVKNWAKGIEAAALAQAKNLARLPFIAPQGVVSMAKDAHGHWDEDRDAKVGKHLLALAGANKGYDKRADAIHAAIAAQQGEKT